MEFLWVWVLFAFCCVFLVVTFGRRYLMIRDMRKKRMAEVQAEKDLFSHLTSEVFDATETIDLTRAVIYHIQAKEDRYFEDDEYDGNLIPRLSHEELMVYTLFQLENSLEGGRGSVHSFFISEPYCEYRPYYREALEIHHCHDIVHLLEEAEKLADLIENDQEDDIDEDSDYATYNFADFTNELMAMLRSSNIAEKLGEYIREHKESFIEKEDHDEERISE